MSGLHVVVGAGSVGQETARRLVERGERVRLLNRSGSGPEVEGAERIAAEAADGEALAAVCPGAEVVYNCVNPAYHRWVQDWPPVAESLLAAAQGSGAVLATVSNLYVYGAVTGPVRADTPLGGSGTKAQVRSRMWRDALAAHQAGRVRVTEVRGSDYICAGRTSHLGDPVAGRIAAGKSPLMLVQGDHPHTFTAIPDVAATLIAAATAPTAWGRAWHVPSAPARTPRQAVADIAAASGSPSRQLRVVPRWVRSLLGVGVPFVRELSETDHEWDRPFVLDDTVTRAELGLAHTPWEASISALVQSYSPTPAV